MAEVFVSYANEDVALAREVRRWLKADRHEVFLAGDLRDGIAAGEQWRLRLHERLRSADAVVCVLTSAYLASTWCTAEVAIAQSRGTRVIPMANRAVPPDGGSTAVSCPITWSPTWSLSSHDGC
ncbi:MAG: toll/interleukin-1 receptor domain-containing protein [Pseudonocardiaceae bacterium]